jgi:recombinational DNA repair ATPase RecF
MMTCYENLPSTMHISKFQVLNFKSYRDSNEIELKPGFNIITGQNSAGKTALLEAMTLRYTASPHRSLRTVPAPGSTPPQESSVRVTLSLTSGELLGFLHFSSPRRSQETDRGSKAVPPEPVHLCDAFSNGH